VVSSARAIGTSSIIVTINGSGADIEDEVRRAITHSNRRRSHESGNRGDCNPRGRSAISIHFSPLIVYSFTDDYDGAGQSSRLTYSLNAALDRELNAVIDTALALNRIVGTVTIVAPLAGWRSCNADWRWRAESCGKLRRTRCRTGGAKSNDAIVTDLIEQLKRAEKEDFRRAIV
jgi:hypothetical protein